MKIVCSFLMLSSATLLASAQTLTSGHNTLSFVNGGITLSSSTGTMTSASVAYPIRLLVCQGPALASNKGTCSASSQNADPSAIALAGYDQPKMTSATQVTASAVVPSPSGSGAQFLVTDVYQASGTAMFTLTRTVTVQKAGNGSDIGFNTIFQLGFGGTAKDISNYHLMAPAMLYDQNQSAPSGAIATDLANSAKNWFFWRETRSGLPMVMLQENTTGTVLSIGHTGLQGQHGPVVSSNAPEGSTDWLVDPTIAMASVGVVKVSAPGEAARPMVGVMYPAGEGSTTYEGGGANQWAWNSHPVSQGFTDSYVVSFGLEQYTNVNGTADFPTALGQTYHDYFEFISPTIAADHAADHFTAAISLLKDHLFTYQGNGDGKTYPGFPFQTDVHNTEAAYSYEIGYDGGHLPLGFQLLRDGVLNKHPMGQSQGLDILNFWATQDPAVMASNGNGLPETWFEPDQSSQWSNGCPISSTDTKSRPVWMRQIADGMEQMVNAAVFARQQSSIGAQTSWESFANEVGLWLLSHQDKSNSPTNGSFKRAFDPSTGAACAEMGPVDSQSLNNTTFPIRFLVQMYFVTGDSKYMQAARAAGAYAWTNLYQPLVFTGGIVARNNEDRESGAQALHAALAMYDMEYSVSPTSAATTQWLQAARIAADYVETYQYVYPMIITDATPSHAYQAYVAAGSQAISLSGPGVSTGDIYMSAEAFDFFRMHLLADDATNHYLHAAEVFEYNTKTTTQLDSANQNFGYSWDGFLTEAVNLVDLGFGANAKDPTGWLNWLTVVELEPYQNLADVFGNGSINQLAAMDINTLKAKNHQIYPAAGTLGWTN